MAGFTRAPAIASELAQRAQRIAELSNTRRVAADALAALRRLPSPADGPSKPTMVPLGPQALAVGRLASGRILAYLGEGYFAWRTREQACGVAERRIMYIDARIAEHRYAIDHLQHLSRIDGAQASAREAQQVVAPKGAGADAIAPPTAARGLLPARSAPAETRRVVLDSGAVLRHLDDGTVDICEPFELEPSKEGTPSAVGAAARHERSAEDPATAAKVVQWLAERAAIEESVGAASGVRLAEAPQPAAPPTEPVAAPSGKPDFDKIMAQLSLLEEAEEVQRSALVKAEKSEVSSALPATGLAKRVATGSALAPARVRAGANAGAKASASASAAPSSRGNAQAVLIGKVRAAKARGNDAYRRALAKGAALEARERELTYASALYTDALALLTPEWRAVRGTRRAAPTPKRSEPEQRALAVDIRALRATRNGALVHVRAPPPISSAPLDSRTHS